MSLAGWPEAPAHVAADASSVHVWAACLDEPPAFANGSRAGEGVLDAAELERARRFSAPPARALFVLGRVLLRSVLSRYVDRAPAALELSTSPRGKVHLAGGLADGIEFNVSHSGRVAVCAVATRTVGIDVEYHRDGIEVDALCAQCFGPNERREVMDREPASRLRAFYELWTRKEAYVKATGEGLSRDLLDFEVAPLGSRHGRALRSHRDPSECGRWSFRAVPLAGDYAGTLVAAGSGWDAYFWRWPPS